MSQVLNSSKSNMRFPDEKQRKRLQKLFEAASKQDSLEKYDYAADLYAQCVHGDPGNYEYLRSFMSLLHKKYVSAKKLGPMAGFKARAEKAARKRRSPSAIGTRRCSKASTPWPPIRGTRRR